jgi:mannose-6-phosphate isomerase-like protein (cupin superfamily)
LDDEIPIGKNLLNEGNFLQTYSVNLGPEQTIPKEVHIVDQIFILLRGSAKIQIYGNETAEEFETVYLQEGFGYTIPSGTYHEVINSSNEENAVLVTIYSGKKHNAYE